MKGRTLTSRPRSALIAAAVLAVVAIGPVASASVAHRAAADRSARFAGTFVSKIPHTKDFIAVVVGSKQGRKAVAYICDGHKVSLWYLGHASGNSLDLTSRFGDHVHATVSRSQVTGTIQVPGSGKRHFTAQPAHSVAGMYLVTHSVHHVHGFSGKRAELRANVSRDSHGRFHITGTVTPRHGASLSLKGPGRFAGSLKKKATWIVLANGQVTGGVGILDNSPTNVTGGGTCSLWSKIRQIMTGVYCRFLQEN